MFGKLRQGSGGTYFINVQQVLEKVKIQRAQLSLQIGIDVDSLSAESAHNFEKCGFLLNEKACESFDNVAELENNLPVDVKDALVYIAGYVTRKDENLEGTQIYYSQYGNYTAELNRGGLNLPTDNVCQWVIFSYIAFHEIANNVCRKSLCNVLFFFYKDFFLGL